MNLIDTATNIPDSGKLNTGNPVPSPLFSLASIREHLVACALPLCAILIVMNAISPIDHPFLKHAMSLKHSGYPPPDAIYILYLYISEFSGVLRDFSGAFR